MIIGDFRKNMAKMELKATPLEKREARKVANSFIEDNEKLFAMLETL